jgi:hypothetical protein
MEPEMHHVAFGRHFMIRFSKLDFFQFQERPLHITFQARMAR